jgi:hypothetical protein
LKKKKRGALIRSGLRPSDASKEVGWSRKGKTKCRTGKGQSSATKKRSFFSKCGKPNLPLQTLPFEPAHQKQLKGHSRRPHENGSSLLGAQQKGGNFGVDMP